MLRLFRTSLLTLMGLLTLPQLAQAHFLWIVAGSQAPDGKIHLYFGESAIPDDPELLRNVAATKLIEWQSGISHELPLTKGEDSLVATPTAKGPAQYTTSFTYGLMTRGDASFLLQYHAKTYNTDTPRFWTATNNVEKLPFEIVPRLDDGELVLKVLWDGKPLGEAEVTVSVEGQDDVKGMTEKRSGEFRTSLPMGGRYSFRAKFVEKKTGEHDGKTYQEVRHYTTLALQLPKSVTVTQLPPLADPVTSFGAAILGDDLYVYGGHLGSPHHYSTEGQSDKFLRLNLKNPEEWKSVGTVPKRTGLAMVPHNGKLYRVGGFIATNKEADDQVLVSAADVAEYDPQTNAWTELTSMPSGRSSHDALVIGDRLYVVGGWEMKGDEETTWHKKALVANLAERPLVWEEIDVPFERRALSVGEWQGKLVAIGGMQSEAGPTTKTSIYDPATKTWTEGPDLLGQSMDGFGSSAFACGNELFVSTFSGTLQRLSADGTRWDVLAQLQEPRFFHRMVPTADGQLLILGGASMQKGKIGESELVPVVELTTP